MLSTQHAPDVKQKDLREGVMEEIIKPVLPARWLSRRTKFHINPTGRFVIGGPVGRLRPHRAQDHRRQLRRHGPPRRRRLLGQGSLQGRPLGRLRRAICREEHRRRRLAQRCEVQVSYAIGVARPTSVSVRTFGTGRIPDARLEKLVTGHFDLRPFGIIRMLDLVHPMYRRTASYGHFGREPAKMAYDGKAFTAFSWERTDRAEALRKAAGL